MYSLRSILFLMLFGTTLIAGAQDEQISASETIAFINEHLDEGCEIEEKKGITVNFYKNGELYRRDIFVVEDLDPETIKYSEEDKYISIHCYSGSDGCIDRKLFESKIRRPYKRITFPVSADAEMQKKLISAFKHLIMLYSDPNYKGVGDFK